jgi:hypothetical protein
MRRSGRSELLHKFLVGRWEISEAGENLEVITSVSSLTQPTKPALNRIGIPHNQDTSQDRVVCRLLPREHPYWAAHCAHMDMITGGAGC